MAKSSHGRIVYGTLRYGKESLRAKLVVDDQTVYVKGLPETEPKNHSFHGDDGKLVMDTVSAGSRVDVADWAA